MLETEGINGVIAEEVEFERLTEDSLLKVQALPAEEQQHPVLKGLGETVKRQIRELLGNFSLLLCKIKTSVSFSPIVLRASFLTFYLPPSSIKKEVN